MDGFQPYVQIYGSVILDEIHNYFPELLYEQQNFNSIDDVFLYVNQQITRRFNPFAYGRQQYLQHRTPRTTTSHAADAVRAAPAPLRAAPAPARAAPAPAAPAADTITSPIRSSRIPTTPPPIRNSSLSYISRLFNIPNYNDIAYDYYIPINNNTQAFNSIFRQLLQEYDSAVPIRPSEDQLSANTTIIRIDDITIPNSCSICQEDYAVGDTIRKINHCTHYFHKSCIDSWFISNARCPVCRHDIRDATASP